MECTCCFGRYPCGAVIEPERAQKRSKRTFRGLCRVGELSELEVIERSEGLTRINVLADGAKTSTIQITWAVGEAADGPDCADEIPQRKTPAPRDEDDMRALPSGHLTLSWPHELAEKLVPGLSSRLPVHWISAIATASRLVGVDCPGQDSVFVELELSDATDEGSEGLNWAVERYDARFKYADISLKRVVPEGARRCISAAPSVSSTRIRKTGNPSLAFGVSWAARTNCRWQSRTG